tara:strand:+ start:2168 stop:2650 length:483 start_codon:yes stop_codon:yes gene_type:complete
MKVLFLHGLESKPGGTKANFLNLNGFKVLNPHLPRESFEDSVRITQEIIDNEGPDLIVGSSRGGAVAMCVNTGGAPVVLIAPGWKRFMNEDQISEWDIRCEAQRTIVLHSPDDDIIPIEDSYNITDRWGVKVIEVGAGHRMSDDDALAALLDVTKWLVRK